MQAFPNFPGAADRAWENIGHESMNSSIHLAKRPKEKIVRGETFELRRTPIPRPEDVKDKQALIRVEYLSVDPGITFWIATADSSHERLAE